MVSFMQDPEPVLSIQNQFTIVDDPLINNLSIVALAENSHGECSSFCSVLVLEKTGCSFAICRVGSCASLVAAAG